MVLLYSPGLEYMFPTGERNQSRELAHSQALPAPNQASSDTNPKPADEKPSLFISFFFFLPFFFRNGKTLLCLFSHEKLPLSLSSSPRAKLMENSFQPKSMGKGAGLPRRETPAPALLRHLGHERPPTYRHYLSLKDFGSQKF